ncbi:MAG: hypothetical protein ACE5QV_01350, partial [Fidelibacterota bacterium]
MMKFRFINIYSLPTLILVTLLLYSSCVVKKPEAPQWETDLAIPLIDARYYLGDLANDTTIVIDTTDNVLKLNIKGDIDTVTLDKDNLTIPPSEPKEVYKEIGQIKLGSPGSFSFQSSPLSDIFPGELPEGVMDSIPAFSLPTDSIEYQFHDFKEAGILQGNVIVTISNQLKEINLGPPVFIILKDMVRNIKVGEIYFEKPIKPGESATDSLELSGKTITNNMRIITGGSSPGTEGRIVEINRDLLDSKFSVTVKFTPLVVEWATAIIPEQVFDPLKQNSPIKGGTRIISGEIEKGGLIFNFTNTLPLGMFIEMKFLNFLDPQGDPKVVDFNLKAHSDTLQYISLTDYTIKNITTPDQPIKEVNVILSPRTLPSDSFVTIYNTDYIYAGIQLDTLIFRSIQAIFHERFPTARKTIDQIPEGLEGVDLADVTLILTLYNEIEVPTFLDLQITGKRGGQSKTVVIDSFQIQSPASALEEVVKVSRIILDKDGVNGDLAKPTVIDMINLLPDSILISGEAIMDGRGEVNLGESVWGSFEFIAPFRMKVRETTFMPVKYDKVMKFDEERRDQIKNNLVSATF